MIKSLRISNFSVFTEAEFCFGKNLNVLVGENGSGKTHLLRLAYSLLAVCGEGLRESKDKTPSAAFLQNAIARKLLEVFCPDKLGNLMHRPHSDQRCSVGLCGIWPGFDLNFDFGPGNRYDVIVTGVPEMWLFERRAVFLPPRELLSIYPGFLSLYDTTNIPFDRVWRDTCAFMGARDPRDTVKCSPELLAPIEQTIGGQIVHQPNEPFYLERDGSRTEIYLVAEGLRKFGMLARLLVTGSLFDGSCLFLDEPEASLNPKLVREMANAIVHLCRNGIQVFVATHSLFLMRELYMLEDGLDARYFGLHFSKDGSVSVREGESVDDIGPIAALDEDLQQSDRYMDHEDAKGLER